MAIHPEKKDSPGIPPARASAGKECFSVVRMCGWSAYGNSPGKEGLPWNPPGTGISRKRMLFSRENVRLECLWQFTRKRRTPLESPRHGHQPEKNAFQS